MQRKHFWHFSIYKVEGKAERLSHFDIYKVEDNKFLIMSTELFSRKQVAEIFGIKPRTIWKWEKRKVITPALYVNGRPRYSMEEIEKVAQEFQTIKPKANEQSV